MDKKSSTEFWNNSCIQFDLDTLSKYSLTQDTRKYLSLVGLPVNGEFLKDLNISFYSNFEQINVQDCDYIAIGDDYGTKICINGKSNEVVSIDIEEYMNIRFINSSIENFIDFLQIYFTKRPELAHADDEKAVEITSLIKDEFNRLDPRALDYEENWWTIILEQTEQGLL